MSAPGTISWFAAHESRLAWRDFSWLLTRGGRRPAAPALLGFSIFVLFLHGVAFLFMTHVRRLSGAVDAHQLAIVAGMMALTFSAMLSQAMESVTRAFYARGDLEFILTSPAKSARLFAVRIAAVTGTILASSLIFATPAINMQAILDGPRWLCAYLVIAALAMLAVALAIGVVSLLFATIGAKRTRFAAQIVAAVIGAAFAIGLQFAAIISFGSMNAPRFAVLEKLAEDPDAAFLWPARAVFGEAAPLLTLMVLGLAAMALVIGLYAPRFGRLALAAGSVSQVAKQQEKRDWSFAAVSPAQALRKKELSLIARDPWLLSQTLMQLLYLAPAAFMLWRSFFADSGVATILSPILIMAAGQLAGGLAWLAVSGEDAPELIATSPVAAAKVLRAKTEAVLIGVAIVFLPLIALLAFVSPFAAAISLLGVAIAASASTAIQYWFRAQAKRSMFRRRQTSSKIATFAEAFSSNGWAGVGAVAVSGSWLAVAPALLVAALLAGVWWVSPARAEAQA